MISINAYRIGRGQKIEQWHLYRTNGNSVSPAYCGDLYRAKAWRLREPRGSVTHAVTCQKLVVLGADGSDIIKVGDLSLVPTGEVGRIPYFMVVWCTHLPTLAARMLEAK